MKTKPLSPKHAEILARFRIPLTLLEDAGVYSASDADVRELLGINGEPSGDLRGFVFPYNDPITRYRVGSRVRLDRPIDDMKYVMERANRHLYFAPIDSELLKDPTTPVVFVEAEKSALAISALARRARRQYVVIATGGCCGWKRKRGKKALPDGGTKQETDASPDLDLIYWKDRSALIAFDSNAQSNDNVRRARNALRKYLVRRGAHVSFVEIPFEDEINGPDDFIAARGDEAMIEALDRAGEEADTLGHLIVNSDGLAKPSLANAITVLRDATEWKGVLAFDEFSLLPVVRKAPPWPKVIGSNWTDTDDINAADWLQRNGKIDVNPRTAADAAMAVAAANPFHPVKEYLDKLVWDGEKRIGTWLSKYLGVREDEFARAVGPRWLISAVARIYDPGCRVDHTLLLEGPQGIRKSTALATLAGAKFFSDQIGDLSNKDSLLALHGVWIIEFAELASIRRSQVERVKSFLTSTSDYFRPPYGRRPMHVPRTNVFAGSVNEESYLSDETGNRRFWPVRCGKIDIDALKRDRDQIWAEALERYKGGDAWWLDTEELNRLAADEQDERYEPGPWDQVILTWLAKPTQRTFWIDNPNKRGEEDPAKIELPVEPFNSNWESVTITDVLLHAVGKRIEQCGQADRNQVGRCLTHAGWKQKRKYVGDDFLRFYMRPRVGEGVE